MFGLNPIEALEESARNGLGLFGADDEEQEQESSGDESSNEEENNQDDDETGGSEEDEDNSDDTDVEGLKSAKDRALKQKSAAIRRAEEAERKLKELQGEDKRPVKEQIAEKDQTIEAQSNTIRDLRIQNAFLLDNTHDWHNPTAALRLADMSDVEIDDEDGSVSGLKEALAKVAKAHPYLIKQESKPAKKSGDPQSRKDDKATKTARQSKLRNKYKI